MNHALELLAELPGIRHVMLVSDDGVPVATFRGGTNRIPSPEEPSGDAPEGERPELEPLGTQDALAGLAIGLLTEISQAAGQLSWNAPRRVVLKATRGTLVLQTMRGAVLLVLLGRGSGAEETRLAMEGTIARIERSLRSMGRSGPEGRPVDQGGREGNGTEPPGPIPTGPMGVLSDREVEAAREHGEGDSPRPEY